MELGLHFQFTDAEVAPVLDAAGDDDKLLSILAAYEEDEAIYTRACETDKAWDPIACALSPEGEDGDWPARGVIGGARSLQVDGDESWVTHLAPTEVAEVAGYLAALSPEAFSKAYADMPEPLRNPEYGEQEESYAAGWLEALTAFYATARDAGNHVVFTVSY